MERPRTRALSLAIALAAVVMIGAVVLRVVDVAGGTAISGTALLPLLFTGAGLSVAGLLRHRSPALAWLAAVVSSGIAAIEVVGVVRAWQAATSLVDWPWLVAGADAALVLAAAIAAAYALQAPMREADAAAGRRTARVIAWQVAVLCGAVLVLGLAGWAISAAFGGVALAASPGATGIDISPFRASGRVATGFIAMATFGGAVRDLAGPARRAWTRAPSLRDFPRVLADELLPTSAAMRRRGEEDERARLAAELHARLLPDLRRAADAAEAAQVRGVGAATVAVGLRQAVEDVEQLMHARQSVVLEEYGLVAALEWLAERTQQRTQLLVDLDLDGSAVDDPAAIARPVARAAFRVALLAIDNVIRHAGASRVVLRLQIDPGALTLTIIDDGRGIDAGPGRHGGRGLADMRSAAAEIGAGVRAERISLGTRVELIWPRAATA